MYWPPYVSAFSAITRYSKFSGVKYALPVTADPNVCDQDKVVAAVACYYISSRTALCAATRVGKSFTDRVGVSPVSPVIYTDFEAVLVSFEIVTVNV